MTIKHFAAMSKLVTMRVCVLLQRDSIASIQVQEYFE